MHITDTYVYARIDSATKRRAAGALKAMDLSISDAIRLLMLRVADERRLPFEINVPNSRTQKAMMELESGKGMRYKNIRFLIKDLNTDN
jgi:DNA-damage-inducible protein J